MKYYNDFTAKNGIFSYLIVPWVIIILLPFACLELYSQNKSSLQKYALPKGHEIFINDFSVPVHIAPSKESEILKKIPYGSKVSFDSEFLVDPTPHWLPILTGDGVSGFIMRSQMIAYPSAKRFQVISKDVQDKIAGLRKNALKPEADREFFDLIRYEIADFLFQVVKEGDFTGNEYLFLKTRGGEALALTIASKPTNSLNPLFLRKYEKYLTKGADGKIRMDENFFWKHSSLNSSSLYGDIAAQLAVEFTPVPNCSGDPGCFLDYINYSYLKYLGNYPKGKKSSQFTQELVNLTERFVRDKDEIRCFPPLPQYKWMSLERTKFRIQYLNPNARSKMTSYLNTIEKECFPSYKG